MAGDLVLGVGESLPTQRPASQHGSGAAAWRCSAAAAALQPAPLPCGWLGKGAPAAAAPAALPQRCPPAAQPAGAQLPVVAGGPQLVAVPGGLLPPAATAAAAGPARLPAAAAQRPAGPPAALPPALATQPSDPDTQPLAAGLHSLPSFGSWRASGSQGRSSAARAENSHRRSRSLGSGRDAAGREVGGSGCGGRGSGCGAATVLGLPGPVPRHTSDITFMPLGHQGGKWAADPAPQAAPAGATCCAATVAAVPILTRSTVAALLGERQQPEGAGRGPAGRAVGCNLASEATGESAGGAGASPAAAAPPLSAYRPWTAVRRVIEEVGRPAALAGPESYQSQQRGQRGAAPAAPPLPCWASADSAGTVAMPWDHPSVRRPATSSAAPPASQRSLRRPPRPPGGRAAAAAPRPPQHAVQARPALPPMPPPVRWAGSCLTQDTDAHLHPLLSTALPHPAPLPLPTRCRRTRPGPGAPARLRTLHRCSALRCRRAGCSSSRRRRAGRMRRAQQAGTARRPRLQLPAGSTHHAPPLLTRARYLMRRAALARRSRLGARPAATGCGRRWRACCLASGGAQSARHDGKRGMINECGCPVWDFVK